VEISNNYFSFFSTLNQYFPHIPYVASKKDKHETIQKSNEKPNAGSKLFLSSPYKDKVKNIHNS
jgi:hypothetical protein